MRRHSFIGPMIFYGIIWAGALAYTIIVQGQDFAAPVFHLLVFGICFPIVAWFLLLGSPPMNGGEQSAPLDIIALLIVLATGAAYLTYGPEYLVGLAESVSPDVASAPLIARTIGNVAVFVIFPIVLFVLMLGHRMASFGWHAPFWNMFRVRDLILLIGMGGVFLAYQAHDSQEIAMLVQSDMGGEQLKIGLPVIFVWLVLEVGLVQEFFFRGVVQSRLAIFLRNEWLAMFIASLLFALSHVPGVFLQSEGVADPWACVADAILTLSVSALIFGYIWMRTRNLLILMLLHGAASVLPNYMALATLFGLD